MEKNQTPRKRYKLYGEPGSSLAVPRNTAWRINSKNARAACAIEGNAECLGLNNDIGNNASGSDMDSEISEQNSEKTDQLTTSINKSYSRNGSGACSTAGENGEGLGLNSDSDEGRNSIDLDMEVSYGSVNRSQREAVLGGARNACNIDCNEFNLGSADRSIDDSDSTVDDSDAVCKDNDDNGVHPYGAHSNDCSDHFHPVDDAPDDSTNRFSDDNSENEGSEEEYCDPPVDKPPDNTFPVEQHQPPNDNPDHELLRKKLGGQYAGVIQDRIAVSRGEMLLNIQEFCRQHPLPLTAQEDLHKLVNSFFYKEIIPDTTYKLDKIYSSSQNVRYFFYCKQCFEEFGDLDYKTLKKKNCPRCGAENNLNDLTKAHYFVIIDFIKQLQLLLEDPEIASKLKNPNEFPDNGDILKDLQDGQVYKDFVSSIDFTNNVHVMSFTACTDGTPLYHSSTLSIWPLFVILNELPLKIRTSNVLLAGLWFGRMHPKMDLFLQPFCNFVRRLSVNGFHLKVCDELRLYRGYLIAMCVDSGARGSIQCVHSHNGAFGCNWCLHPGEVEGGGSSARKYPQLTQEPAPRTEEQMKRDGLAVLQLPGNKNHVNGVIGLSPLLRCPKFHIINGMVLDNLHWASFGVARRMGKLWLGETKKKKKKRDIQGAQVSDNSPMPDFYIGTDETKALINRRISKLRPPLEIRRRPRDLSQLHDYNAREWENMILYFSVPLFKNILPDRYLKHWTLFTQAFYLLVKSDVKKRDVEIAGVLMKTYVNEVQALYGKEELNFNVHISNHAEENAWRWGPGFNVSTYAFENGNKILKSKIHAERGIPHQLVRSLNKDSSLILLRKFASTPQSSNFRSRITRKDVKKSFFAGSTECIMPHTFLPSAEENWLCARQGINCEKYVECKRVIVRNICYAVDNGISRTDNSFALANGEIFKIRKIIAGENTGSVFLFVSRVRVSPYHVSRNVSGNFTPFLYNVDLVEEGAIIISSTTLKTVCVNIYMDCCFLKAHFISVMANTANTF